MTLIYGWRPHKLVTRTLKNRATKRNVLCVNEVDDNIVAKLFILKPEMISDPENETDCTEENEYLPRNTVITQEEVQKIASKLSTKAPGPDGVTSAVAKEIGLDECLVGNLQNN